MSISGINSGQGRYNPNSTHKFTKIQTSLPSGKTNTSSTVNISEKAKELSQNGCYVDVNDPEIKAQLEAIALPDWFAALMPEEAIFNPETAFSTPLIEHYTMTGKDKDEIVYCKTILSGIFCDETIKTGITSAERYSMKTSQPDQFKEYDEKLHQAVRNRLLEDGQYVKYMEYLEKSRLPL